MTANLSWSAAALALTLVTGTAFLAPAAGADEAPTCLGMAATMVGTEGDDVITGTGGSDVIVGLGGGT